MICLKWFVGIKINLQSALSRNKEILVYILIHWYPVNLQKLVESVDHHLQVDYCRNGSRGCSIA